ncbi:MAG: hypothetical protein ABIX36_17045 [Mucilaginibacter sp.]
MIRGYIYRFNDWFNSRGEWMQICLYLGFCIVFLGLLAVSIYFSRFDEQVNPITVPTHIGQPSGPQFTDSLTSKKH